MKRLLKNFNKLVLELIRIRRGFGLGFLMGYIGRMTLALPEILRRGTLGVVDERVHGEVSVRVFGRKLRLVAAMMPTIREVLLKNCYRFDPARAYRDVIDLGANRGVFSVMAAAYSERVFSVECNPAEFRDVFLGTMAGNGVRNVHLISKFAGSRSDETHVSLGELVRAHGISEISFLKVDIEGSETDLFSGSLEWLDITREISMEVHPVFGVDADGIVDLLQGNGFLTERFDLDMRPIRTFKEVPMGYLRATRP